MYELDVPSRSVLTLKFDKIKSGWEQYVLLRADAHHDNIHCNRALEKEHLEEAKDRNAVIADFGDLFCAMQGKYDPRSSMDDIRSEDVGQDYLDLIVKHAAEFYGPYAKNFALIGKGNHELNIRKRHGTDLTSNLVHRLNSNHSGNVQIGGVGGWIRFLFKGHRAYSVNLKYHHGAGGGGPVTRGVIQTARQAVYLPDADIVVNGHTHDGWILSRARERLSERGQISKDLLWFGRTPGYKDEYSDGFEGFHNEQWRDPRPQGALWLRFWFKNHNIEYELIPAFR